MATWPVEYDESRYSPNRDSLQKLHLSMLDAEDEPMKTLICPVCDHRIAEISITQKCGMIILKCQKCKGEYPFNLAYYRRQKKTGYRLKFTIPAYEAEE